MTQTPKESNIKNIAMDIIQNIAFTEKKNIFSALIKHTKHDTR